MIHWGGMFPPTSGVAVGDIYVRNNGNQQRATALGPPITWVQLQPDETRGDILPGGGTQDQVLVRANALNQFNVIWADPGPGLIWQEDFTNSDTWFCPHSLRNKFVSVLAIKDDGTVMIPDIDYENATIDSIILKFEDTVSGTAVIRR